MFDNKFNYFLKDKNIYLSNQKYWYSQLKSHDSRLDFWLTNTFLNGEPFYDGNPLASVKYGNIAIRIIQISRDTTLSKLITWNEKHDDFGVNELVIHIQPYSFVYEDANLLIALFLKGRHLRFQSRVNKKYNRELFISKRKYILKKFDDIKKSSFLFHDDQRINLDSLRKLSNASKIVPVIKSGLVNKEILNSYNKIAVSLEIVANMGKKNMTQTRIIKIKEEEKNLIKSINELAEDKNEI